MTWQLTQVITLNPGQFQFHQPFIGNSEGIFVNVSSDDFEGGTPLGYANIVLFGSVTPSGSVGGVLRSALLTPAQGAFLRQDTAPFGLGGWFLQVYAIKRKNGTPTDFLIYRDV